tara:strand:- start:535 stop:837 length:303 start_codon:yes stop_codon:yes gene_type:complete
MKDTNAIEEALKKKIHDELWNIVDKFVTDCQTLSGKYGAESAWYSMHKDSKPREDWKEQISSIRHGDELQNILVRMLKAGHGEQMLKIKTRELLSKLELL